MASVVVHSSQELPDAPANNEYWEYEGCRYSFLDKSKSYCVCSPDKAMDCLVRAHLDCPEGDPSHYEPDGCRACGAKTKRSRRDPALKH